MADYEVTLSADDTAPMPSRLTGAALRKLRISLDEAPAALLLRCRRR